MLGQATQDTPSKQSHQREAPGTLCWQRAHYSRRKWPNLGHGRGSHRTASSLLTSLYPLPHQLFPSISSWESAFQSLGTETREQRL